MALNWPTFFKRLGSAVVFAAIMMTGLLWKDWMFAVLVAVIMTLCIREFFRLGNAISGTGRSPLLEAVTQGTSLLFLALFSLPALSEFRDVVTSGALWPVLLPVPVLLFMTGLLSPKSHWQQSLIALGSLLYIVLPCSLLIGLRQIDWIIPLALILLIWTNDTMAYLVGSFIGKTPFSKISPKKTWEGTIGGALFTIALAGVWGYYSKLFAITDWMLLALCAAVAGTAGDLLESKLKRMAGVKDSGTMMPGHGGALDRFDSLLVATPFAFAYAFYFMQ
jgi:phosphatidate cytidylyltransferase